MNKTLFALRVSAGLRQVDVARSLGVSQVSVWQWEHGRNFPNLRRLPELAELYECEVTDLIEAMTGGGDGARKIPAKPKRSSRAIRYQQKGTRQPLQAKSRLPRGTDRKKGIDTPRRG